MVALAYSYLGQVAMASIVDDDVSVDAFRKQLGTFDHKQLEKSNKKPVQGKNTRPNNPLTLIHRSG